MSPRPHPEDELLYEFAWRKHLPAGTERVLLEHLGRCPRCRREVEERRAVFEGMIGFPAHELPDPLPPNNVWRPWDALDPRARHQEWLDRLELEVLMRWAEGQPPEGSEAEREARWAITAAALTAALAASPRPRPPEGERHELRLTVDAAGWRDRLDGRAVRPGDELELWEDGRWARVRYERHDGEAGAAALRDEGGAFEVERDWMRLRWPDDPNGA